MKLLEMSRTIRKDWTAWEDDDVAARCGAGHGHAVAKDSPCPPELFYLGSCAAARHQARLAQGWELPQLYLILAGYCVKSGSSKLEPKKGQEPDICPTSGLGPQLRLPPDNAENRSSGHDKHSCKSAPHAHRRYRSQPRAWSRRSRR